MYTNSMMNLLMGGSHPGNPVVGMGATILHWTDRTACTVVAVNAKATRVTVQHDKAIRTDSLGMSDAQSYSYEVDPEGVTEEFSLRKNGRWVHVGSSMNGQRLSLGHRSQYHDYCF